MKKWQKQLLKSEGKRDYEELSNEDSGYSKGKRRDKPHSVRDRHAHAVTKREVVIESTGDLSEG